MAGPSVDRILVTGAGGFLGRHVLRQLADSRLVPIVMGRHRPKGYSGEFVEADLLDSEGACSALHRIAPTHLLHLAWYTEHGKYWNAPINLRWVDATVRLVQAFCLAGGRRVVGAGSCAEYDWSYGYCREDETPVLPLTLYGTCKDVTRRLVTKICNDSAVSFAWARIFIPFGPGEDERRLIPALARVFKGELPPFGVNVDAFRDFLHAEDVARAFAALALSDARGTYNVASGDPTRIGDLVRLIADLHRADPKLVLDQATSRPGEPALLVGDAGKLRDLAWRPTHRLADWLSVTQWV